MTLSDSATVQLWETFRASGGAGLIRDAVELPTTSRDAPHKWRSAAATAAVIQVSTAALIRNCCRSARDRR